MNISKENCVLGALKRMELNAVSESLSAKWMLPLLIHGHAYSGGHRISIRGCVILPSRTGHTISRFLPHIMCLNGLSSRDIGLRQAARHLLHQQVSMCTMDKRFLCTVKGIMTDFRHITASMWHANGN